MLDERQAQEMIKVAGSVFLFKTSLTVETRYSDGRYCSQKESLRTRYGSHAQGIWHQGLPEHGRNPRSAFASPPTCIWEKFQCHRYEWGMEWKERCIQASLPPLRIHAELKGATLKNWGVLIFARRNEIDRDVDGFIRTLCQTADDKGMQISQRHPMKQYADTNWTADEITRHLQMEIMPAFNRRGNIELLIIVTPARTSVVYAPIKRYCDTSRWNRISMCCQV